MIYPLVVSIGFNRPDLLKASLARLSQCADIARHDVVVFLDGPRNEIDLSKIKECACVAMTFKSNGLLNLHIVRRERNLGCRRNVIKSISEVFDQNRRAIIVEDDVLVSRTFLQYMDRALEAYESDNRIWCINAYQNPNLRLHASMKEDVYLAPRNMCWGWGCWKDRWCKVDFDMKDYRDYAALEANRIKIHNCGVELPRLFEEEFANPTTWDLQCTYHMIKNGLFAIEPRLSLTKNMGVGVDATHSSMADPILVKQVYYDFLPHLRMELQRDQRVLDAYKYICSIKPNFVRIHWKKLLQCFSYKDEAVPGIVPRAVRWLRRRLVSLPMVSANSVPRNEASGENFLD